MQTSMIRLFSTALVFTALSACTVNVAPSSPGNANGPSNNNSSNGNNTSGSSAGGAASSNSGSQLGVPTEGMVEYLSFNTPPGADVEGVTLTADRFGIPNSAYNFDGQKSAIKVNLDINPEVKPALTLSAWVRYLPLPDAGEDLIYQVISHDDGAYDRSMGIDYRSTGGQGWSMFAGDQGVLGSSPLKAGEWAQLTSVYDQSSKLAVFYVNGKEVSRSTEAELGAGYDYLLIGSNPAFVEHFPGDIDEVRIYERALSEAEVKTLYERSKP